MFKMFCATLKTAPIIPCPPSYLLCYHPAIVLPVVSLQTPGTPGLCGGLVTNNDGLLTRELLKAPQVSWLLREAGGVRQPGTVNILTVRVRVQATVTLTTILQKSLEGLIRRHENVK